MNILLAVHSPFEIWTIPLEYVGRLSSADVAEFGLRWQGCEEFLRRLGYRATVKVSKP